MKIDYQPYYIVDGPQKGGGSNDQFQTMITSALPEYTHENLVMNYVRFLKMASAGSNVCGVGIYKSPEREQALYFSIPIFLSSSQVIIMKQSTAEKLGLKGDIVSLVALGENKSLIAEFNKDQVYGTVTEIIYKNSRRSRNVKMVPIRSGSLFEMLHLGRVDYMIDFSDAAYRYATKYPEKLVSFKIKEEVPYVPAFVACSKTPIGLQLIGQINPIIRRDALSSAFRDRFEVLRPMFGERLFKAFVDNQEKYLLNEQR